ncbi:NAD(P)H-dependent flavin oxidoreductase [Mycolicibacter sinensis]|uniref:2-nitropropane dioxygenase n=1 Tax=Mycolicibacter sinensis (strain JDM601) TaxID=875328 RepID=A0A1A2NSX5_MYCSD|nr:nitronate monooxygenase [Mycolicibacter sinensis]OBH18180.1 2-nitropropane dioxygenase [Mycolicibacter sinensis]OBI27800.1 2-nitropropane dioxygenase [Mycolicibacter sinensis]
MNLLESLGLSAPVMQAGMGGGVAGAELAGAVSAAGALGTVGLSAPRRFAAELHRAVTLAGGRPVAANLLVPFARRAHIDACITAGAALVVFHDGAPARWIAALRTARIPVLCTAGDAAQARRALAAGASGLVAQGVEAGGHLVADRPLEVTLPEVLQAADGAPVLAAGGVADADDVRALLAAGAAGAVAGTRFLLTEESCAHPGYKQKVLAAQRTIRTMLFGMGWPLAHRVVPNALTERWCARNELGPPAVRAFNRAGAPLSRLMPVGAQDAMLALQRVAVPLYTPALPLAGMDPAVVERSALYAGETIHRIHDIIPAAQAVARLTP